MIPPFETHRALRSPHGFFGRQGGVSDGVYTSLNTGLGSGDDRARVETNRDRVRLALGADHLFSLYQVHSAEAVILEAIPDAPVRADGVVTRVPGLALSAQSADCGPLLLEDVDAGVVAACHAGWRGALGGVVESTVAAMCEAGAAPNRIRAVLGPCISQHSYEVGEAFRAAFLEISEDYAAFFAPGPAGVPHFDLPAFILSRLDACGVAGAHWTGHCTYAQEDRYFSYRRSTHQGIADYGRNISTIMMPP
ncbi:MAG: peptidoglycan editing factor PgeF [Litorimonas sp.]